MPAGSEYHEPMTTQPYDIRNFLPMNLMEPSYARSDQTPLQLVYDPRYHAFVLSFIERWRTNDFNRLLMFMSAAERARNLGDG